MRIEEPCISREEDLKKTKDRNANDPKELKQLREQTRWVPVCEWRIEK